MRVASFEQILKEIAGYGNYVYLHIKGEPLLHPNLENLLDLCAAYGVQVNITTNGTLLSTAGDMLLNAKAVRQVSVSLQSYESPIDKFDSYMDEVLRFINKGRANTEKYFELRLWNYENNDYISDADNKTGNTVDNTLIETPENFFSGDLDDIQNRNLAVNTRALIMIQKALDLDFSIDHYLSEGKGNQLVERVYISKATKFQWPSMSIPVISTTGTCYGLRQQIGILVNGDVVPCCLDNEGDAVLGNVFSTSFESIVNGEKTKAIIQGFESGIVIEPLCMRCGYRARFEIE